MTDSVSNSRAAGGILPRDILASLDWRNPATLGSQGPGPGFITWLLETGSLTQRLREACADHFGLEVVREEAAPLTGEEMAFLSLTDNAALLREVSLKCNGKPCVFAQTLIPGATLMAHPWLEDLGEKPLGEALLGRDDVRRPEYDVARLNADQVSGAVGKDCEVWTRRSRFLIDREPLLVYEVFLPAIIELIPAWESKGDG